MDVIGLVSTYFWQYSVSFLVYQKTFSHAILAKNYHCTQCVELEKGPYSVHGDISCLELTKTFQTIVCLNFHNSLMKGGMVIYLQLYSVEKYDCDCTINSYFQKYWNGKANSFSKNTEDICVCHAMNKTPDQNFSLHHFQHIDVLNNLQHGSFCLNPPTVQRITNIRILYINTDYQNMDHTTRCKLLNSKNQKTRLDFTKKYKVLGLHGCLWKRLTNLY